MENQEPEKPIVYLKHPVSIADKRKWTSKGFRIVDARFKPEGEPDAQPHPHLDDSAQKAAAEAAAAQNATGGNEGQPQTQAGGPQVIPPPEKQVEDQTITIPADWKDLSHQKQISIANQIKPDANVTKKDEAIAVIQAAIDAAKSQQA